jgi:hypothetical protein
MRERKTKNAPWQTPEQRAAHDAMLRRKEARARLVCNKLKFWMMCPIAACRRRRTCTGDPEACFKQHWAVVPEDQKTWLRAGIKARMAGHSPEEAARIADGEQARIRALMEKFDAPPSPAAAEPIAEPDAEPDGKPTHGPRLRRL